jgi:hypothetical protein
MGLGSAAVKLNLELWQRGFFRNIKSVVDMGSQELHMKLADFEELVRVAAVPNYKKKDFANLAHWPGYPRCSSKPFYEMLGAEKYSCIDLGGGHGAMPLDLNMPLEDHSLYGQYDLVTDYGNNEHIFNTAEAYRTMHRLCKRQGIMIIVQAVYNGNGYYSYDLSFFEGIAAANNYKILFSSYVIVGKTPTGISSGNQFCVPLSRELLDLVDWAKVEHIGICYVVQKQSKSDFHYPYQGDFLSEVQGHHGYELQFLPEPPSRTYLPLAEPWIPLYARFVKELAKRVFRY